MAKLAAEQSEAIIVAIATEHQLGGTIYQLDRSTAGVSVLQLEASDRAALVAAMLAWLEQPANQQAYPKEYQEGQGWQGGWQSVFDAFCELTTGSLPLEEATLWGTLGAFCQTDYFGPGQPYSRHAIPVVTLIKDALKASEPTPELRQRIEAVCDRLEALHRHNQAFDIRRLIQSDVVSLPLQPGEAWSDRAIADLTPLTTAAKIPWAALLLLCSDAQGGKPSAKWLKAAETHIQPIGVDIFQHYVANWFALAAQPRTQPASSKEASVLEGYSYTEGADNAYVMWPSNVNMLKGLCWLCPTYPTSDLVRGLAMVVVGSFRKVPGVGPVCIRLGNAALWALGQIADVESTTQLARLKAKVKLPSAQKSIAKALTTTAKKAGVTLEELEELAVPDFGFTGVGQRREVMGDAVAELVVQGNQATLNWFTAAGKLQKSVPQAVKDSYGEAFKDLKQTLKDVQGLLPAQRDRLEALYLARKTWPLSNWREHYLDHPLVGTLARRLIWQFEADGSTSSGSWHEGHLVTVTGDSLENLPKDAIVSLWHPIAAAPDTVLAWRTWLVDHQIQQPFKQAHRELYLLTAAEQTTATYSNRFAAHVLKQLQFHALCNQRGWRDRLRMMNAWEPEPSVKPLPPWNLRAEFWLTGIGEDYAPDLTTDAGAHFYLSTDQVRFYPLDVATPTPLPLQDIPALAFSEVMRDVDLFLGVASVGNDPAWVDGGLAEHRDYWHTYSFGALSETAQTRRQVLETLVPSLAISDRCTFQDRFLVVRGDLRTYKIHLGSGNILMEPNDQYLCIVPDQRQPTEQVFLPFEGDSMTMIVLSKALLLAHDTKIKDPNLLGQIKCN